MHAGRWLAAPLIVLLAACGGDDDDSLANRESATPSPSATAAEPADGTTAERVDTDGAGTEVPSATASGEGDSTDEGSDDAGGEGGSTGDTTDAVSATTDASAADSGEPIDATVDELFPDVVDAVATFDDGSGTWRFDVTLSSPYDTPERYADAWRVLGPDGTEYGVRELAHDHANEQPFTRSLSGVEIPESVTSVTIEGRDQVSGYGGARLNVELVRS